MNQDGHVMQTRPLEVLFHGVLPRGVWVDGGENV